VSVAHAASGEVAVAKHCHDSSGDAGAGGHSQAGDTSALPSLLEHSPAGKTSASSSPLGHSHGEPGDHCKSGACKCSCAHLPALATTVASPASAVPHPPVTLADSAPVMSLRPDLLFRPPI
jgi:hypothetical protein